MRVDLGTPSHGWMTVSLRAGDAQWSGDCSYVADCVAALVEAALRVTERRPVDDVVFFHEPDATVLRCGEAGDHLLLSIAAAPAYPPPSRHLGDVELEVTVARDACVRAVWAGIRRLEGRIGRDAFEAGWQAPFPARAMDQLGERLRSR